MPTGRRIDATPDQVDAVAFNADGLVAAIAQDVETREVLMMAWMNAESLRRIFFRRYETAAMPQYRG